MDERLCICGDVWADTRHKNRMLCTVGHRWHGAPAQVDPWSQWVRERLPATGFIRTGDDGIVWATGNPKLVLTEIKTNGAPLADVNKQLARLWVDPTSPKSFIGIRLVGGNVPGTIEHYPKSHAEFQNEPATPTDLVIADRIFVYVSIEGNYPIMHPVDEDELIATILDLSGYVS